MSKLTQFTVTGKEKDDFYGFHRVAPSQTINRTVKKVNGNEAVFEYSLATAYTVSTATFIDAYSIQDDTGGNASCMKFNNNGTKMYIVDTELQKISEYELGTAYDVSTAYWRTHKFVKSEDLAPTGFAFNGDGTKMYVVGTGGNAEAGIAANQVNEYALSSAYQVETATWTDRFSVNGQDTQPRDIYFNNVARGAVNPGGLMFLVGQNGNDINEYLLGTEYDASTASFVDSHDITTQTTTAVGLGFDDDGDRMYVIGNGDNKVHQYPLVTNFDVSTTQALTASYTFATNSINARGFAFNNDGTKMFVVGDAGKFIIDNGDDELPITHIARTNNIMRFLEGNTYKFDVSDNSMTDQLLKFSTTKDGTIGGGTEYTTNVTSSGTAGSGGAYVQIVVPAKTPSPNAGDAVSKLFYYGPAGGMGAEIFTPEHKGELQITFTNGADDIETRYETQNQEDIFEDSFFLRAGLTFSIDNGDLKVELN